MNQRDTIIKLTKDGLTEKEIEEQLHILFGQQAYSRKTIYKWFSLTKIGKENEENAKSGPKPDEQLISRILQILDEDPYVSTREIADTLNENESTIWRYLTRELGRVFKYSKWLPHCLNYQQKTRRMHESKELFDILTMCKKDSWRNILTGDQSWFRMAYDHEGAWLLPEDENPQMNGSKISIQKYMVTIIWGVFGFFIVDILPHGVSYDSTYFIEHILYPLYTIKTQIWSETYRRKLWLHLDNSMVHNSQLCQTKYNEYGFKRTPHPPYSPDLAPSDFYLFGAVKNKLKGSKFTSSDELKEALIEILNAISQTERKRVFEHWIERCKVVNIQKGEYFN